MELEETVRSTINRVIVHVVVLRQMYEELVQKSHDLDTKFSRSVARNFL